MRKFYYATTALVLFAGVARAQTITPGSGSLTDAGGNTWLITSDGSVQENGQWTPGGGGTAALLIENDTVFGLDFDRQRLVRAVWRQVLDLIGGTGRFHPAGRLRRCPHAGRNNDSDASGHDMRPNGWRCG